MTLTPEECQGAEGPMKDVLAPLVGRDLCGVLSEVERYIGVNRPVQPSVSFTSYLAGVLLAAELIKEAQAIDSALSGRYQIDPIATLSPDSPWAEPPQASCYCVTRSGSVAAYRRAMRARYFEMS